MTITLGELAGLAAAFVIPVLLVAGIAQFILLRPLRLPIAALFGVLVAAAIASLLLTWGLLYVVPTFPGRFASSPLLLPALLAALLVTVALHLIARRRRAAPEHAPESAKGGSNRR